MIGGLFMSNDTFFDKYQNIYPSLQYFHCNNNYLVLNYDNTNYSLYITHINLSSLAPEVFLLNPVELFQMLYILELFYKVDLTDDEIKYITDYVNKYLELNDKLLANEINDDNAPRINSLSIPVYTSYNDGFTNTKCAMVIQNIINNHTEQLEKGEGKGVKLVLTNPNFKGYENEDNNLDKTVFTAGFTITMIIVGTIIAVSIYVAYFILNH